MKEIAVSRKTKAPVTDIDERRVLTRELQEMAKSGTEADAAKRVENYAGLMWDAKFGDKLVEAQKEHGFGNDDLALLTKRATAKTETVDSTDQFKSGHELHGNPDASRTAFKAWPSSFDRVMFTLFCVSSSIMLALSGMNAYAVLMSTAEAVFLENPSLAIGLSCIVPMFGLALKGVTMGLRFDHHRQRFKSAVLILTVACGAIWLLLFSGTFQGYGGGINVDEILDSSSSSAALIASQITFEVLIGLCLMNAAESVWARYSERVLHETIDYPLVKKAERIDLVEVAKLRKITIGWAGEIKTLEAKRKKSCAEKVAMALEYRRNLKKVGMLPEYQE